MFESVGPVELEVHVTQSEAKCHLATVDLGSVYKTHEGDSVYRLEKADVVHRNKWELVIAMEFKSGLIELSCKVWFWTSDISWEEIF